MVNVHVKSTWLKKLLNVTTEQAFYDFNLEDRCRKIIPLLQFYGNHGETILWAILEMIIRIINDGKNNFYRAIKYYNA